MIPTGAASRNNGSLPDPPEWREQIIVPFCWESLAAWGEGDAAGNDNYYSTRVFRNPLEVTRENHRSAARYEVGWYRRAIEIPDDGRLAGQARDPAPSARRISLPTAGATAFTWAITKAAIPLSNSI